MLEMYEEMLREKILTLEAKAKIIQLEVKERLPDKSSDWDYEYFLDGGDEIEIELERTYDELERIQVLKGGSYYDGFYN